MRPLSARNLESRRVFDWNIAMRMSYPGQYAFSAHRTAADAQAGVREIEREADARHAVHYRAVFHIRTLVGPNRYSPLTIARVDASAATYPFTGPVTWIVEAGESQMPWSPHFLRGIAVCNGTGWRSDGRVVLGEYFIHLARLLNWDEKLEEGYGGYNFEAVRWWRENLGGPLDPALRYPVLPDDLMYGEVETRPAGGFRPLGKQGGGFRCGGFRPVGR